MARILGIDYGQKRTGIAVTDPMQMIASGLTMVETHLLMSWLQEYCKKEEVERFVVGLPLHADGNATAMSEVIEVFVGKLMKQFPDKQVLTYEERNSSQEAMRIMIATGVKKKKRQEKGLTDKVAAGVILQHYMQEHVWK
jgi:putative holliday junction resolvase